MTKKTILALIFLCSIPGNSIGASLNQQSHADDDWITVFVHGILFISPKLVIENIPLIMGNRAHETRYGATVECTRSNPTFFENQAMQETGLRPIDISLAKKGYASGALARTFDMVLNDLSQSNSQHRYYTFGWSGLLSKAARKDAARQLYQELGTEIHRLRSEGVFPKVRIVGYSHGGNVSLNVAKIVEEQEHKPNWLVDELILIATPVITETDEWISSPFFTRAYSLYSKADKAQSCDCLSFKRFFSDRCFRSRDCFCPPDKLTQIQVKVLQDMHYTSHDKPPRSYSRLISPGHSEWWFFGWTPKHYRKKYPLYPLPTVVFLPYIIDRVNKARLETHGEQHAVVSLVPSKQKMIIMNKSTEEFVVVPFIPGKLMAELKETADKYKPKQYRERYEEARRECCQKGVLFHRFLRFGK